MIGCRLLGHRYRFSADGRDMRWACARCGTPGGSRRYPTAEEACQYAAAFNVEDRGDLGRRAPLIGLLPLRIYRAVSRPRQRL